MQDKSELKIVSIESDLKHLTSSFDEFKEDTKKYHISQKNAHDELANRIDKLANDFSALSSAFTGYADLQKQINDVFSWRADVSPFIQTLMDNRKIWAEKAFDYAFKIIMIAMAVLLAKQEVIKMFL